ncbi:unnamed protein product [Angiostrongylus costaricensis]|uniref:Uncharacterized protein n=1 Tax=Angiostrongylus costaricensis TaxID=334426 RepID=A0A0R3PGJ2_ANGCS|nr:unnamed protein product [Angiostrongylus costaricensis]
MKLLTVHCRQPEWRTMIKARETWNLRRPRRTTYDKDRLQANVEQRRRRCDDGAAAVVVVVPAATQRRSIRRRAARRWRGDRVARRLRRDAPTAHSDTTALPRRCVADLRAPRPLQCVAASSRPRSVHFPPPPPPPPPTSPARPSS